MFDGIHVIELALHYSNRDSFLKRTFTFLKFAIQSVRIALFHQYDLVFATTTPLTAGIPGVFATWLRRKPFVFEVRDLWPELPKAMGVIRNPLLLSAMSCLEWVCYRSATRLIGLSPGIVEGIRRRGVDDEKILMIPNGCDLNLFSVEADGRWRPDGVATDDLLAVYTGTHGIANGLDAVLDAAAVLKRKETANVKFAFVGDGKQKQILQKRAKAEQLDNVIFHPPVSKQKLTGLLLSADLGLQVLQNIPAFYYGTSPNKFFDYLASGLPTLTNYPGWVAELIEEYDCGYHVPPDDPAAFAETLMKIAREKDALTRKGLHARQLASEVFHRDKLGQQFIDWLEAAA